MDLQEFLSRLDAIRDDAIIQREGAVSAKAFAAQLCRENAAIRAHAGQRARGLGEDRRVCVQPNPVQRPDAERQERRLVLEGTELRRRGAA